LLVQNEIGFPRPRKASPAQILETTTLRLLLPFLAAAVAASQMSVFDRFPFAFTVASHIILVIMSISLIATISVAEFLSIRRNDAQYGALSARLTKAFTIAARGDMGRPPDDSHSPAEATWLVDVASVDQRVADRKLPGGTNEVGSRKTFRLCSPEHGELRQENVVVDLFLGV
jgi:hypothetical protein